jgi:hypothetical protein
VGQELVFTFDPGLSSGWSLAAHVTAVQDKTPLCVLLHSIGLVREPQ